MINNSFYTYDEFSRTAKVIITLQPSVEKIYLRVFDDNLFPLSELFSKKMPKDSHTITFSAKLNNQYSNPMHELEVHIEPINMTVNKGREISCVIIQTIASKESRTYLLYIDSALHWGIIANEGVPGSKLQRDPRLAQIENKLEATILLSKTYRLHLDSSHLHDDIPGDIPPFGISIANIKHCLNNYLDY